MYFQAMHPCKNYEAKVNQPMSMEQKKILKKSRYLQ